MTNDVEALDSLVTDTVVTLFQASLTLIGSIVILLLLDVELALHHVPDLPGHGDRLAGLPDRQRRRLPAHARDDRRDHRLPAGDAVGHPRRARVRAGAAPPRRSSPRSTTRNREANLTTVNLNAAYFPLVEFVSALATVAILLVGRRAGVIDGDIEVGVLVGFIAALNGFFDPIGQLSQVYTTYQSGMAALDKIFELLDEEPDLVDAPDAIDLAARCAARSASRTSRSATATADGPKLALDDVSLVVPPGQTVALVGATGAGKSTFAKLVARFYDPTDGRVLVDGVRPARRARDVAALADGHRARRRRSCSAARVADNIAFGRAGRHARARSRRRRARSAHGSSSRRCPHGLRHRGRRARRPALGRPAPARRLRPRAHRRPAHPRPRRGDLERRPAHRGPHRGGPAAAARRAHRDRHRPPPVDDPPGRPDRRARPAGGSSSRARTRS